MATMLHDLPFARVFRVEDEQLVAYLNTKEAKPCLTVTSRYAGLMMGSDVLISSLPEETPLDMARTAYGVLLGAVDAKEAQGFFDAFTKPLKTLPQFEVLDVLKKFQMQEPAQDFAKVVGTAEDPVLLVLSNNGDAAELVVAGMKETVKLTFSSAQDRQQAWNDAAVLATHEGLPESLRQTLEAQPPVVPRTRRLGP